MKHKDSPPNNLDTGIVSTFEDSKKIKKECLRLLTRRDHSRKEMQEKLVLKGYDRNQVGEIIDELSKQNWQDDFRYAESYARVRSQKGFGPGYIAYELRQQGVAQDTIEQIIRSMSDQWMILLEQAYTKKYPDSAKLDNNERAKRIRFLMQRGFTSTMITALFNQLTNKSSLRFTK